MRILLAVVVGIVLATSPTLGHHSPAAFRLDSQVTIQGVVSRVDWRNPHVYIYIHARDGAGDTVEWTIETDPVPLLARNGWTKESMAPGDLVTVRANPDRDPQKHHALLVSIALENGDVLTPRSKGAESVARASSVFGVWDAMRGFNQRRLTARAPDGIVATDKGRASQLAYSVLKNPAADCVPYPSPYLPLLPYLNEIERRDDTVIIRSEFFNVDRIVYMDGREHPRDGPRTNQGHSIGWWEDDVLVVDTTHFDDHLIGNDLPVSRTQGTPSGAGKHVVEKYQVSEDGTRLLIDFIVEDPEYLAEPFAARMEWDYAPGLTLMPFGCDPEQAKRFTFQ